jgi:hypothetical protein
LLLFFRQQGGDFGFAKKWFLPKKGLFWERAVAPAPEFSFIPIMTPKDFSLLYPACIQLITSCGTLYHQ